MTALLNCAGRFLRYHLAFTLTSVAFGIFLAYSQDILIAVSVFLMLVSCYIGGYIDAFHEAFRSPTDFADEAEIFSIVEHDCTTDRKDGLVA